jgi:hypothetical protein
MRQEEGSDALGVPWLAGLAGAGLLLLSGITAVVRAEATEEGYELARAEAELARLTRRTRGVDVQLLQVFAQMEAGQAAGEQAVAR